MAIAFTKYILITSGVGGGNAVKKRELIGRIFTTNPLVPTGSIVEFTTLADVGTYFGTTSEEYKRASFYFGFISKSINSAKNISFARWNDVASVPQIYGGTAPKVVGNFSTIPNGTFVLTIGGTSHTISTNLTTATDLATVASLIQTQVRLQAEPQFATASVTFDAARNSFNLDGAVAEAADIAVTTTASGTSLVSLLNWDTTAIFSKGALAQTITNVLTTTTDLSNNFGSYLFIPPLTITEIEESSIWNKAQNVFFQYYVPVDAANAQAYHDALINYGGTGVVLASTVANEYHEMVPMAILASTDYTKPNATKNYMYYQAALTPTVTTTTLSNTYDTLRVNYYGRTQTAGQFIDFFQRGTLMGLSTDPVDMNTFANEQWFKDYVGAEIMSLQLSLEKISANVEGIGQIKTTIQTAINLAVRNGVVSVGKTLNNTQKLYIAQITNSDTAWIQVENIGYWFTVEMQSYTTIDGRTEYKAVYTVIYSKDDVVRKVEGSHILI
jgi:hypothetical protein